MGKIIPEQNQEKKLAADSESFGIPSMFYEAFAELAKKYRLHGTCHNECQKWRLLHGMKAKNAGFAELAKKGESVPELAKMNPWSRF